METPPVTVVETDEFLRQAKAVFSAAEADALKTYLAYNPKAGVVMRGTGGVRKLRWAIRGRANAAARASFNTTTATHCPCFW